MSLSGKKRIFYILMLFAGVFVLFAVRVAWIQWTAAFVPVTKAGKTMNELAVRQREEGVELDSGRGQFADRNGEPFTGQIHWKPTLFPISELPPRKSVRELAGLLGTDMEHLSELWMGLQKPYIWPDDPMDDGKKSLPESLPWPVVKGFELLPYKERYPEGLHGKQWLGFTAQRPDEVRKLAAANPSKRQLPLSLQLGASGLEKTLDRFLHGDGETRVYYSVDGRKRAIDEIGTRAVSSKNRYFPVKVNTTIDLAIQQRLEKLTEEMNIREGAVVVLDTDQSDIVAMVSRPFFDPKQVDIQSGDWSNRAVKAAIPGSIFKTVVAAAALEKGVAHPGEKFHCSGHYGKYGLACWKKEGHGTLTLEEGFARSCNVVFASLGERLTASDLERTAAALGLNRKVGWNAQAFMGGADLWQIDQEEKGALFGTTGKVDGGVMAQTALGQRDVLMTPLQAANLIVTLLHDGQVTSPRLVRSIQYNDGTTLADFPVQRLVRQEAGVSAETARTLLAWMRMTVTDRNGTGRSLLQAAWPLAGKSGTAEAGKGESGRNQRNHQWFIGYGPKDNPRYAVAVLVQNRPAGSPHQAVALFRSVMDTLAEQSKPGVGSHGDPATFPKK
ncbi:MULTISPECIES: peptidoglycan D,D-transpeptidase FtsI family protein [Paenibacillus]|uniref:peptidoglycan D,D-transpeptidase FtsI family protein n=1 Tax=Paenibacillus TaxID=44249 RepID=UPI002FE20231